MSWAHWIRAIVILILVLIALLLVRVPGSGGQGLIDLVPPIDAPISAPAPRSERQLGL